MKSGKRDRAEGTLYKVAGGVLGAVGSLTDDRKKRAKGRLGRGGGAARDGEGRLKGLFKKQWPKERSGPRSATTEQPHRISSRGAPRDALWKSL